MRNANSPEERGVPCLALSHCGLMEGVVPDFPFVLVCH